MADYRFRFRTRWQIALRYSGLPTSARAIAWALSTWMLSNGSGCTPSLDELAGAVDVDRRTVMRALDRLERDGWVSRSRGSGRGRRTAYMPLVPAWADLRVEDQLSGNRGMGAPLIAEKEGQGITKTGAPATENRGTRVTQAYKEPNKPDPASAGEEDQPPAPWLAAGLSWQEWSRTREATA